MMEERSPGTWPRLGAIAVCLRPGAALLVRRRNPPDAGLWGFPGGHVEPGETALAAALRELGEETGIVAVAPAYLTCLDIIRHDGAGRLSAHYLLAAVTCRATGGTLRAGDDADEAAWIPDDRIAAAALPLSRDVARVLALARERS